MKGMSDLVKPRGATLLVAIVPVFPIEPRTAADSRRMQGTDRTRLGSFESYPFSDVHQGIAGFLGRSGIRSVDLLEVFQRTGESPEALCLDAWHPNARGHRVITDALLAPVLALGAP